MLRLVSHGWLIILLLMGNIVASAQIIDDFEDGDLTNNPTWTLSIESGTDGDFVVVNGILKSKGPAATSTIWASVSGMPDLNSNTVSWTFDIRYLSPPSGSNNVKVFLQSSVNDLAAEPEGYFLQLGESGSNDGIDLMKTSSATALITDTSPSIANGINTTIQVIREGDGTWFLNAGSVGDSLTHIGSVRDTEFTKGEFFGFLVSHTRTRNEDFEFDNIEVKISDNSSPHIIDITVVDDSHLGINFSEELSAVETGNIQNYLVNNLNPISSELDSSGNKVSLILANPLQNGSTNLLIAENLQDLKGNMLKRDSVVFVYFQPTQAAFRDIIISEILADPTPQNDLPNAEFIELFNRSDKIFDLGDWSFCDASQCGVLMSVLLFPGQRIILCNLQDITEFEGGSNIMGLEMWPTLNNAGDNLTIKDSSGELIDSVNYSDRWFESSSKREGGWSLELIDVNNFCTDENNWRGSIDDRGGTPGFVNSINSLKPDLNGPLILEALGYSEDSVIVKFNENLDRASLKSADIKISQGVEIKETIYFPEFKSISLLLSTPLISGLEYNIKIFNVTDCSGNVITENANVSSFRLLETPAPEDIVINEILFNPRSGGTDFIEIYNKSERHLNLSKVKLANFSTSDDSEQITPNNIIAITGEALSIKPKEYLALTTDALVLAEQYPQSAPDKFIQTIRLPSMPDESGEVLLMLDDSSVLDKFQYTEDFHSRSLNDNDGVSLERISFNNVTQDPNNWTSAAADAQYATPGSANSQLRSRDASTPDNVIVSPKTINLDDSQNNFVTISYNFSRSGGLVNLGIYDIQGRRIASIAENQLLGFEGFFKWEGYNQENIPVRMGYYIIYFEVLFNDGQVEIFKRKVAVIKQF